MEGVPVLVHETEQEAEGNTINISSYYLVIRCLLVRLRFSFLLNFSEIYIRLMLHMFLGCYYHWSIKLLAFHVWHFHILCHISCFFGGTYLFYTIYITLRSLVLQVLHRRMKSTLSTNWWIKIMLFAWRTPVHTSIHHVWHHHTSISTLTLATFHTTIFVPDSSALALLALWWDNWWGPW